MVKIFRCAGRNERENSEQNIFMGVMPDNEATTMVNPIVQTKNGEELRCPLLSLDSLLILCSWKMPHLPRPAGRSHDRQTRALHYYQRHTASIDSRHEQSERPVADNPVCTQDEYTPRFETLPRATLWPDQAK